MAPKKKSKAKAAKRSSVGVGGSEESSKVEPTRAAYFREVKYIARNVLALRRERKGDRAFALEAVTARTHVHTFTKRTARALAVLIWSPNRAEGWGERAQQSFELAIQLQAEHAFAADVWAIVQSRLPKKLQAAASPRYSGPQLRDGYAFVNDSGYRTPQEVQPDEWIEAMLTRSDVARAAPIGTVSLYGDRLQVFRLADGRFAAVTMQSAR